MPPRLAVLLLVAVVSGLGASTFGRVTAEAGNEAAAKVAPRYTYGRCPIPSALRPAFVSAARVAHIPLALLSALAQVESEFTPGARSHAGAVGLLQVMPETGRDLGLDVHDPTENVLAGARYLRLLLDQFNSSELALAAYNAGPTAVERAGGIPSDEVARYVSDVTDLWRSLNGCR